MTRKGKTMGRKAIKAIDKIVNYAVIAIILAMFVFAGYALWDSKQIYREADKSVYEIYKPEPDKKGKSFEELQLANPEVFSWLTVYGTNIDYPVTQGIDNFKYVNTNAEGRYSLSGSVFLDYRNSNNFSDFNSILYGHHMENKKMFGEIGYFSDKKVFDEHKYGNLYYDGKDHGIEFFAFIHTDAYDNSIFSANISDKEIQNVYISALLEKAMYKRDIGLSAEDRIILLTTCSGASTNGRDILAGRVTDEIFPDPFVNIEAEDPISEDLIAKKPGAYGLTLIKDILLLAPLLILMAAVRLINISVTHISKLLRQRRKKLIRNIPESRFYNVIVLLALTLTLMSAPAAVYAADDHIGFTVRQEFVAASSSNADNKFTYILKPLGPDHPMPAGSEPSGYTFSLAGTNAFIIGPLSYAEGGIYRYELFQVIAGEKPGYSYDKQVYSIEVQSDPEFGFLTVINNKDGAKTDEMIFTNKYNGGGASVYDGPKPGGAKIYGPKTGDAFKVGFWAAVFLISFVSAMSFVIYLIVFLRRKRDYRYHN